MINIINLSDLDGKTLKLTHYCEDDVCLLVGRDVGGNVFILREEINRKEGE